ncbi:MAG: M20/M25/M40 family metallo-hydrolase [Phycisphaerae bacterium]|nr:M20/M25/M40 family metallo-hydrolase [Phycisphaerae bacterium]
MLATLVLASLALAAQAQTPPATQTPPPPPHSPAPARPTPAAEVSAPALEATLRALPVRRAGAGDAEDVAGLLATQALLLDRARAMGDEPETPRVRWKRREHGPDSPQAKAEWSNIVFERRGTERPREVILVGAHFDAVPGSPGADDNATGVAALLEVARVLKDRPARRTIRFALFNLEEAGLVGSTQYAAAWSERNADAPEDQRETITLMLSLEMLGCYSDAPGSQAVPFKIPGLDLPTVGDFIALAGVLQGRPAIRQLAEQMRLAEPGAKTFVFDFSPIAPPDLLRSDHAPFLLRGIPAVMVTDTANFRNPHYHQPTDEVETIDLPRFAKTVSALAGAVHALAGPQGQPDAPAADLQGLPDMTKMPGAGGGSGGAAPQPAVGK